MSGKAFIKGLAIGAIIGGAAGVLFAPRSGEETRQMIADKKSQMRDKMRQKFQEMKENASSKMDDISEAWMERYENSNISPKKREQIAKEIRECASRIKDIVD